MHGLGRNYQPPEITDYGDLRAITATFDRVVGVAATDLSFSSPTPPYGPGGTAAGGGGFDPGDSGGGTAGAGGGGAGSGGGGGGGNLPFTGLAIGAIAAVGSGLAAGGAALRRLVRRR